jgi:transcriptional regulator with XRE-family HTH domain
MNVGERIRQARKDMGMQTKVLAGRVGVAPNSIYRIEAGDRTPSMALLEKIAHELGTESADLLRETIPLGEEDPQHWERVLGSVRGRQREVEAKVGEFVALPDPSKAGLYQVKWALDEAQDCVDTLMLALPGSHRRHSRGRDVIAIDNLLAVDPDQWEELGKAERFYDNIVERLVEAGLVELRERIGQRAEPFPVGIGA